MLDSEAGLVHSSVTTPANQHDIIQAHHLLHGAEDRLCGDTGYAGISKREELRGRELNWKIAARPCKRKEMFKCTQELANEKEKSSARAKVEHHFYWVKCFFEYGKVRYRGLDKNSSRLHITFRAHQFNSWSKTAYYRINV